MTRRRRGFRFGGRGGRPLRAREWGGFDMDASLAAGGGPTAVWIIPPSSIGLLHEPTLVRMLIRPVASSVLGANGRLDLAFGVIKHTGDPDTDPVPIDPPEPSTDDDADWAYVDRIMAVSIGAAREITAGAGLHTSSIIDIATQRKLSNGEGLLFVVDNTLGSAATNFNFWIRFLVKQ